MKRLNALLLSVLTLTACGQESGDPVSPQPFDNPTAEVSLQGNTYTTSGNDIVNGGNGTITGWSSPSTVLSAYFRVPASGSLTLGLKYSATQANTVRVACQGTIFEARLVPGADKTLKLGDIAGVTAGYIRVDLQGISRFGAIFGNIHSLLLGGVAAQGEVISVNNTDYYYWGRRGPSVHMNYTLPASDIEWVYNEVTVPEGSDPIGSYFMANGFSDGYFGMQVNSATERRILFSVWSPYATDDPDAIPDDERVLLNYKGSTVTSQPFGGEGSGRQNFMVFNWKTGVTYGFLTQIAPDPDRANYTKYTCYFYDSEASRWMLIASNSRPKTTTYYTRAHSFLENFNPACGYITRKVYFGNLWACNTQGQWAEVTKASFSYDATAATKQRMDYKGGSEGDRFFLQNCGFFSDYTIRGVAFTRTTNGIAPAIDFAALPVQ